MNQKELARQRRKASKQWKTLANHARWQNKQSAIHRSFRQLFTWKFVLTLLGLLQKRVNLGDVKCPLWMLI